MSKSQHAKLPAEAFILLLLTIGTTLIGIKPIMVGGKGSAFYAIDPDVHYLSNALSFIRNSQIQYIDHPGTPAIFLMSSSLLPLRIYSRLALNLPFTDWSFNSLDAVYVYSRYFQSVLFSLGLFSILMAVHEYARTWRSTLLVFLGLLSFTPSLFMTTSISPETTSFLLLGSWVIIYTHLASHLQTKTSLLILGVLSGVAIANKFTNLPVAAVTLSLTFVNNRVSVPQRIRVSLLVLATIILGFIIGTWPIRSKYPLLIRWVSTLSSSTGIHGQGKKTYFDLDTYKQSLKSQISTEPGYTLLLTIVISMIVIMLRVAKASEPHRELLPLCAVILSTLLFAKYPLTHYQIANYVLLLFFSSRYLSKIPTILSLLLLAILILISYSKITKYTYFTSLDIATSRQLEDYVVSHPSLIATTWEWGKSKDFAFLWSRSWASGLFAEQINKFRPDLLELTPDLAAVRKGNNQLIPVFGICWDKLYVQEVTATLFLKRYQKQSISYEPISGTKMGVITSTHCTK